MEAITKEIENAIAAGLYYSVSQISARRWNLTMAKPIGLSTRFGTTLGWLRDTQK